MTAILGAICALMCLAGCGPRERSVDIDALRMPPPERFAVERVQVKSVVRSEQAPELLTAEGLRGSAYYKYFRRDGGAYKVRINLYDNRAALQRGWQRRYPEHLSGDVEPLDGSLDGFVSGERLVALREGRVLVELVAVDGAGEMRAFAEDYARYVRGVIGG